MKIIIFFTTYYVKTSYKSNCNHFSSKKTAAETRKIEEIKAELAKLDNDLAVDVALLRKQIDNACIHFANVE